MWILKGTEDGKIVVHDSLGGARVGRWCTEADEPDRCDCWDPETMLHNEAQGYIEYRHEGKAWRYGVCKKCVDKTAQLFPHWHKILWYRRKKQ